VSATRRGGCGTAGLVRAAERRAHRALAAPQGERRAEEGERDSEGREVNFAQELDLTRRR
jgi:hypothetical protein